MSEWRNRIVGEGEVDAGQLLANPQNWRVHPKAQQDALEGVLRQVGWVQRVIVNQRTGFVVDGHARVAMAISRGERVPVVYVDLSPEEEALVLATLDPLGAMAGSDEVLLSELKAGLPDAYKGLTEFGGGSRSRRNSQPDMGSADSGFGLAFKVVVDCLSETHQGELLDRFKQEGLRCRALIS